MSSVLYIHAPGVHVGGGGVLLKELLNANLGMNVELQLDERVSEFIAYPKNEKYYYIQSSVLGRIKAEIRLRKKVTREDTVLCFHGMPTLFSMKGKVVVFKQNRIHLAKTQLSSFPLRTRIRLRVEQLICKLFMANVDEYLVQTPTMKKDVMEWHGSTPCVRILPFMPIREKVGKKREKVYDFIYVADGEAHKNHLKLIEAWCLLADEGVYPSLALTLPDRNRILIEKIESFVANKNIRAINLGYVPHDEVFELYNCSGALIFPSLLESFGLPLVEASVQELPVVASERDYVRDVCEPVETFDPESAESIAQAIKRFLKIEKVPLRVRTVSEFIQEI